MSASKLQAALSADSVLVSLVNDRIELAPAPQGIQTPFCTYEYSSEEPIKDLNGITNLAMQDWQITAVSNRYSESERVKDVIINAMDEHTTEFRSYLQSTDYDYDENAEVHKFILDFTISYQK